MKETKLYNVLFPVWMLVLIPTLWLVILPGNFVIDSLVLLISMKILKIAEKKTWYKRYIFKIFAFGMISDVIAALCLLGVLYLEFSITAEELYLTIPAIVLAATLIFLLNYFITFKKEERALRLKMSLIFAIVTAPYTFLIPASWIY